jgi:hypothetical protein
MADTKLGLGLGFDVSQFTDAIAVFTAGPLAWTVDVLAWGLDILQQVLGVAIPEFMPDFAWIVDVLEDIVCKMYTPFGSIAGNCT